VVLYSDVNFIGVADALLPVKVNPLILNEDLFVLMTITALLFAVITVAFIPVPMRLMFLSDQVTPDAHVQEPAGTRMLSPSRAASICAWTFACEQLAARRVAAITSESTSQQEIITDRANLQPIFLISILAIDFFDAPSNTP
jgi:hypothetical protein